jgi:hypothetical protein
MACRMSWSPTPPSSRRAIGLQPKPAASSESPTPFATPGACTANRQRFSLWRSKQLTWLEDKIQGGVGDSHMSNHMPTAAIAQEVMRFISEVKRLRMQHSA